MWEKNAIYVENTFSCFVDWEERFYDCPECGEPIYECDWDNEKLQKYICPVCEFEWEE